MGMTIDNAITWLNTDDFESKGFADATSVAISTMRKYQKIQEILNSAGYIKNGTVYSYTYDEDSRVKHIREVIEDANHKQAN